MSEFAGEREKKNTEKSVKYFKTFFPTFYEFLKQSFQKQDVKIRESRKKTRTTIFSPLNEKKTFIQQNFLCAIKLHPQNPLPIDHDAPS